MIVDGLGWFSAASAKVNTSPYMGTDFCGQYPLLVLDKVTWPRFKILPGPGPGLGPGPGPGPETDFQYALKTSGG